MRKRRVVGSVYGMKYSWKGHKDRNWHKNGIKRNGQARLVCQGINHNIPTTWRRARGDGRHVEAWLQPMAVWCWHWKGEADTSRLDYSRWQYDADTEKERPTRRGLITADGSMMLKLKRRGQHSRLVVCWIWHAEVDTGVCMIVKFKKEANPSRMMFSTTPRGKHYHRFQCRPAE